MATLGKIWGFLKYHHRAVASGRRHWDYDLLQVLPEVLEAAVRQILGPEVSATQIEKMIRH